MIDADKISFDFQLTKSSIARDIGDSSIAKLYPIDYFGKNRFTDFGPDLGAFEFFDAGKLK